MIRVIERGRKGSIAEFETKKQAHEWLMEGLAGTDGAERDHYVSMLGELRCGFKVLHYN